MEGRSSRLSRKKKYTLLRLTWMPLYPGEAWYPFHMVLLQEEGRYMMAYLREDIKRAEFYVGDVEAYFCMAILYLWSVLLRLTLEDHKNSLSTMVFGGCPCPSCRKTISMRQRMEAGSWCRV